MGVTGIQGAHALPLLPIDACLDTLRKALEYHTGAVLIAPPGAGKTSRVPIALLGETWNKGKRILVLEPRRLAARAAADHMASLIGERTGQTIGYRVRMDSKVGPSTRIEFITEGVFTRMVLENPELTGVGCVLFDEFHERNLAADLGLALALDVQGSIRPDLRIVPMSATLDGAKVAQLMKDSPVIESEGRSFPVDLQYEPQRLEKRLEEEMARAIRQAVKSETGSILCFLPGQAEIQRTASRLDRLPDDVDLHTLYGAMRPEDQRAAIAVAPLGRRKIVLATSIAQTSLTLEGVRVVIDSGLARVPRHELSTGLTRLETVKASKAAIAQRAGRAGRTQPGICYRLWHEGQTASLPDYEKPEILEAELGGLVLDLAEWGVHDPAALAWLDQPPAAAWQVASETLRTLGAIDSEGRITGQGKTLRKMPLPPRLAYMVVKAAEYGRSEGAAMLALLITERGLGGRDIDLSARFDAFSRQRDPKTRRLLNAATAMVRTFNSPRKANQGSLVEQDMSVGAMLSFAWPERIARRMGPGKAGHIQYLLVNGRRALLERHAPLASEEWIAVCEIQGAASSGRILAAAALSRDEIEEFHADSVVGKREISLDESSGRFKASLVRRLGQIELSRKATSLDREDDVSGLLLAKLRQDGIQHLFENTSAGNLRDRLTLLHAKIPNRFKPVDDETLIEHLEDWLSPLLINAISPADLTDEMICEGLKNYIGYENAGELEHLAPRTLTLPSGHSHRLDYGPESVTLRARVQEVFGMNQHPAICNGREAVVLELLSPAMRPIQKTLDIAGFWQGSWSDVRKEMRGRYPKHVWPEDPANATPTTRTKPKL